MNQEKIYLPIASLIEILGIMTLLTNKSFVGPLDLGFSIPTPLVSANVQGGILLLIGFGLVVYSIYQLSDQK